jgi:hypothetical protein
VEHYVGLGTVQGVGQLLVHGKTQGPIETDDLADIHAGLVRVDVHRANQLEARALYDVARDGAADGTQPILYDSDCVCHLFLLMVRAAIGRV